MSLSTSSGEWLKPSVAATRALRSARTRNQPHSGLTIKESSFAAMLVLRMDSRELGSVELQVMASRKWRVSRTVAERTFRYAGKRKLRKPPFAGRHGVNLKRPYAILTKKV